MLGFLTLSILILICELFGFGPRSPILLIAKKTIKDMVVVIEQINKKLLPFCFHTTISYKYSVSSCVCQPPPSATATGILPKHLPYLWRQAQIIETSRLTKLVDFFFHDADSHRNLSFSSLYFFFFASNTSWNLHNHTHRNFLPNFYV